MTSCHSEQRFAPETHKSRLVEILRARLSRLLLLIAVFFAKTSACLMLRRGTGLKRLLVTEGRTWGGILPLLLLVLLIKLLTILVGWMNELLNRSCWGYGMRELVLTRICGESMLERMLHR